MRVASISMIAVGLLTPLLFLGQAPVNIEPRNKAKAAAPDESPVPNIRVDTALVLIPVGVSDMLGRPVTGLDRENFRIYDDKLEQTITSISMEDEPIAMGMVFDASGSMGGVLREAGTAAAEFLKHAEPQDEFFLVEFASVPKLLVPLTTNPGQIKSELMFAKSGGSTALLDGVYMGLNEIRKSKRARKAIVVISDGDDNHSRYNTTEVRNAIRETDVLLYTILVPGDTVSPYAPELMKQMAEQTGGRMFPARGVPLAEIAEKVGIDLRTHYVIGYSPKVRNRDGKFHRIEVKLKSPKGLGELRALYRKGYYDE